MSCEDNQSECYVLYEQLQMSGVLTEEQITDVESLFSDFSEAYEEDEEVDEILDDLGTTLKNITNSHSLNFDIPWFVQ